MIRALTTELDRKGIVPFSRFMELALYAPNEGYYEQEPTQIGARGDFYTSVSVGSVFGDLLAFQFVQWLEDAGDERLRLVETGGHQGDLAHDILTWVHQYRPDLAGRIEYLLIEPSPSRRLSQQRRLENFAGQVRWVAECESVQPREINGVLFSNELLDAFPVRRIGWDRKSAKWFEWGVTRAQGNLVWVRIAADSEELAGLIRAAGIVVVPEVESVLTDGFTLDLSPAAAAWWQRSANLLNRGFLLTVDYGLSAEEFLAPQRSTGTLRAYRNHRLEPDPLANPGQQDLTAHVNFSWLQSAGEAAGLSTIGLFSQEKFLMNLVAQRARSPSGLGDWSAQRKRQLQTLIHPEHFGRAFRVLIQARRPVAENS